MADDIDDLLDEVESKYAPVKQVSVGPKQGKQSKRAPTKLEEDISDILADTDLEDKRILQPSKQVFQGEKSAVKATTTANQKCLQVYLGGSNNGPGRGTAISQLCCDQLRCTACDFKVCQFDNFRWASDTNYLFLRNNVPDFQKLKSKLSTAKGQRAYCCQCSWRTVKELAVLNDPELKWHCGGHR